jgi:hypothetical protein
MLKEMQTWFHKNEKDLETSHVYGVDHHDQFPQARWAQHMVIVLQLVNTIKPITFCIASWEITQTFVYWKTSCFPTNVL